MTKPEVNKVNLSIILSQAFHSTKEENELLISEPEEDESDDVSTDNNKCVVKKIYIRLLNQNLINHKCFRIIKLNPKTVGKTKT